MDMLVKLYDLPKSCAVFAQRTGNPRSARFSCGEAQNRRAGAGEFRRGLGQRDRDPFSRQMRSPYRRKRCQSPRSKPEASGQRGFQPVPTYRSTRRTNNGGADEGHASLPILQGVSAKRRDDHEEDSCDLRHRLRIHHWHGSCDGRCRFSLIPLCENLAFGPQRRNDAKLGPNELCRVKRLHAPIYTRWAIKSSA